MSNSPHHHRPGGLPHRARHKDSVSDDAAPSEAHRSVRSIEGDGTSWFDYCDPSAADRAELQQRFDLHPLAAQIVDGKVERPSFADYGDHLSVVMQFPVHRGDREHRVSASVALVVGTHYFISSHGVELKPLTHWIDSVFDSDELSAAVRESKPAHLLYEVVDHLVNAMLPMIPHVEAHIERIEDLIFDDPGYSTVQEISYARRDLISMRRIVKPQLGIIQELQRSRSHLLEADIEDYWGDIYDHLSHFWDSLEELQQILDGLSDTHDTLISNRMNDIMKTLTIISVVLLPLTLVTGWFGMNVPLPYQDSREALIGITVVMLFLVGMMIFYFRRVRWL